VKLHFISGLPRSGSTLLASILRQNPRFAASIMSPVGQVVTDAVTAMGPANEAEIFISDEQRRRVVRGIFENFYQHTGAAVVFDNNRRWCNNLPILFACFPDSKVIVCARQPAMIADSFERLFFKNGMRPSVIYGGRANTTPYQRVSALMSEGGVLGYALQALEAAYYGPHRHMLHIVNFNDLTMRPAMTLDMIHDAIGEREFDYDFDHIAPIPGASEFDNRVSTPGLHDLRSKVEYKAPIPVLPRAILDNMPKPFWLVNGSETKSR
jgi:sulfotransferase